jgi:hypothetical protein
MAYGLPLCSWRLTSADRRHLTKSTDKSTATYVTTAAWRQYVIAVCTRPRSGKSMGAKMDMATWHKVPMIASHT